MLTKTKPNTVKVVLSKKRGKFKKGDELVCTEARAKALVKSGHVKKTRRKNLKKRCR